MRGQSPVGQERQVRGDLTAAGLRDLTIKEGTAAAGAASRPREKHQAGRGKWMQLGDSTHELVRDANMDSVGI